MATTLPEPSAPPSPTESDYTVPDIDAETQARAYAEQKNEIVALNETDGKWKLDVGDAFHTQWQQIKDELTNGGSENDENISTDDDNVSLDESIQFQEDKVFVISLLGNTSSGKSFVARHLFSDSSNENAIDGPVSVDEGEKKGATTANVNCYVSQCVTNNRTKTLVLDYEGEKGSAFPLFLYARRGFEHFTGSAEKAKQRRQAVTDYFPKLAYILSDVVMLLGSDDFASTDYLTRCREFALKANDGVSQMPHRPLLIIIQNKSSFAQSVSSEIVTEKFFAIHGQEAQTLKLYFSDIKCFCLPHTEQLQRTKGGILDGRQIFDTQLADLKALFTSVRDLNFQRMLTHAQWLYLLKRVLEIVQRGHSVSLHTLLNEIVGRDDNETIQMTVCGFLFRYNQRPIHSPQWFADCSQFAIRILAHCLAAKAYGQRELMSERIIHEQCENALALLDNRLDEFRPCEAVYTGKGRSSKNKDSKFVIYCYQHKGAHEDIHRTCQSVYGLSNWKDFLGWPSTDVWPGSFVSSTDVIETNDNRSEDTINDLSRMVRERMLAFRQNPKTIIWMFTDLFRDCQENNLSEVFRHVCFCAPKSAAILSPLSSQEQSILAAERRFLVRKRILQQQLRMMNRFLLQGRFGFGKCAICWHELNDAWTLTPAVASALSTTSSSPPPPQVSRVQTECAICFREERDFLFVPCGHRGFCERCADTLLSQNDKCPICRTLIADKQRVHDV
ncbi:unnamed protein product [Adineta ricciae]|uniref:RING-type domain-containing protein n=1 Tax=Adineta ricciae TaxID=249248 RepID=A0A815R6I5_ADIRI|nr:unnamed protein product [Adineta ricciae]CAF1473268.1 unnamed protein product [Adineta ricciae]